MFKSQMFIYCKQQLGIVKSNRVKVLLIPSFLKKMSRLFTKSLKPFYIFKCGNLKSKKSVTFSYKKKKFKSLKV